LFLTERGEPRAVADAHASVDARPDDAQARLDLAAAYLARDMNRLAVGELIKAGELFLAGGAYAEAARAFADAVVLRGGPAGAEPSAVDALQQAVERLLAAFPDWDPLLAAASRTRLFQGRNDEARTLAEGVLSRNPLDPVATASLLEVLVKVRDPGAAAIADQARNLRDVPGWLRPHLQDILQGL
jgi:thioredoxin-like negative regulator of GroEL